MFQYAIRYNPRIEYGLFSCPVGTTFDASKLIPTGVSDPKTILLLPCTAMSDNSLNSLCSPLNAPVLVFWSFTTIAEYSPYHPKASCPLMFHKDNPITEAEA